MNRGRLRREEQDKRFRLLASFIFNFRYATLSQIQTFIQLIMNLSSTRRLILYALKYEYLNNYYEPAVGNTIYYLTQKGKDLLYSEESYVEYYRFEKELARVNTFAHHNMLVQVYFLLKSHLDISEWTCEWVLKAKRKRWEKIPDALAILPNGIKIAVEAESQYKRLTVLKSFVAMYRYDIDKISKYDTCLVVGSSMLHYKGLKKRFLDLAPDFCNRRFILTDISMLEHGMCFYQGELRHLEDALGLLKKG